jgi:predicted nucleic acid-binding protein
VRVLVDTSIWSLALRRRAGDLSPGEKQLAAELRELIEENRVQMIGPIRQELLSGLRDEAQYHRLKELLRAFPDEPLTVQDYELGARFGNQCRASGVAGSAADFLICAVAAARNWLIFTADNDLRQYVKALPISLHIPRP